MKKLVLFDHDGTICKSNDRTYDSLIFAAEQAALTIGIDIKKITVNWNKIFADTRGTTEKNLAHYLLYLFHIPLQKFQEFERLFYLQRAAWFRNSKQFREYIYDLYYPDAEMLIDKLKIRNDVLLRLMTGNPSMVLQERISNYMRNTFGEPDGKLRGYFGESAYTRIDLLKIAINDTASKFKDFTLEKSPENYIKNVIYIGDSRSDLFTGLNARIKTVWIPSRSLQEVKDIQAEDAMNYIINSNKGNLLVTNNLNDPEVLSFISE